MHERYEGLYESDSLRHILWIEALLVELVPGVDALLHVSQISRAHVEKPADVLKVGQEITAKIVDLNEEEKKISLSMKALEPAAEETKEETPAAE